LAQQSYKENPHVFVRNVQISRADRLRLRVDGRAGHRRALARRPDDSGDRLQLRHRTGGVSRARPAGCLVLGTARTKEKAAAACATFPGKAIGYSCELSDPSSVRGCVAAVKADGHRLDAIICNAGIMMLPKLEKSHGYELQFFTNYIRHFMLVTGLLDQLKDEGRVVMLSSEGHRSAPVGAIEFDNLSGDKGYKPLTAYGQSKIADLLFAKELERRFAGTKKTAYAVHPGVVDTNLSRNMGPVLSRVLGAIGRLFLKSVGEGAATEVFAAVSPKAVSLAGSYLADSNVMKPRADAEDAALATRLWAESERIVLAF
jgi:NAD(P)-dependent dehydrogenase (short-subunit alcohol dehydrogenase family)